MFPKYFLSVTLLQDPERHFFVQLSCFSPRVQRVSQHLFVLLTSLFQCVPIFFGLYVQNEKLALKICHNMSEELFTKS